MLVLFFFHLLTIICFVIPLILLITKNIDNRDKKRNYSSLHQKFALFFILSSYTSFNAYYINLKLKKGSHVEKKITNIYWYFMTKKTKKEISREEYDKEKDYDFRFFSSGWIMFLTVSLFMQKELL